MVLVKHVGSACFHLGLQDAEPELLSLDCFQSFASRLHLDVHLLKLFTPHVNEPLAGLRVKGLVGAEQRPVCVVLDPLHEQVRHPETVEQVASTLLLLTMVLPQFEEVEDVTMPRLHVHREGALTLAATLVDVARRLVEVPKQRHKAVAVAVRAPNVGALCADVGHGHPNATSAFRDERALLEGVVDSLDAVVLHREQETRGHLRLRRACIEESRGGMREVAARHEIVRLDGCRDVANVNSACNPHQHMLRPFNDLAMHAQQV
mmetsp:Transcript_39892/g.95426  ORF Transcript_39892/g.95426 Transcript_39892/m.95426 type:complete len:263 (+) Transcript_39892:3-791(+)